eukprot:857818-Rhodomonas_salina.2
MLLIGAIGMAIGSLTTRLACLATGACADTRVRREQGWSPHVPPDVPQRAHCRPLGPPSSSSSPSSPTHPLFLNLNNLVPESPRPDRGGEIRDCSSRRGRGARTGREWRAGER